MSKSWRETESSQEAMEFSSSFWSAHRKDMEAGQFWADRIKNCRGKPVERLRIALDNLPLPGAFSEGAIATRAIIREKRKSAQNYEADLSLLYWLAATKSFGIPYSKVLQQPGYNVLESIPGSVIKNLPFTYQTLGYEHLDLLNKTDIKWLKEVWGEPQAHSTLHTMYTDVWRKYESILKNKQDRQMKLAMADLLDRKKAPSTRHTAKSLKWLLWVAFLVALITLLF